MADVVDQRSTAGLQYPRDLANDSRSLTLPNLLLHIIQQPIKPNPSAHEIAIGVRTTPISPPDTGMSILPDHKPIAAVPQITRPIAHPMNRLRTTYGASRP